MENRDSSRSMASEYLSMLLPLPGRFPRSWLRLDRLGWLRLLNIHTGYQALTYLLIRSDEEVKAHENNNNPVPADLCGFCKRGL